MSKTFIMIHGRANKPTSDILSAAWMSALNEGLHHYSGVSIPKNVPYEMCYYADLYYETPLCEETNKEPYIPASPGAICSYRAGRLDHVRRYAGEHINGSMKDIEHKTRVFSSGSKAALNIVMEDLGEYYNNKHYKETLHRRLINLLEIYAEDEIILIAHSMGTIVAYNVLRELGRSPLHRHITVEHFITAGSPLGLMSVQGHILKEHGRLRTPSCVTQSWMNFSDYRDVVCVDARLYDDYESNSRNYIRVRDTLVHNDYPGNPHKMYGYLRTPELSEHVCGLL